MKNGSKIFEIKTFENLSSAQWFILMINKTFLMSKLFYYCLPVIN